MPVEIGTGVSREASGTPSPPIDTARRPDRRDDLGAARAIVLAAAAAAFLWLILWNLW